MKKTKRKSRRGLMKFAFVVSLFIAAVCFIMNWWIAMAGAVIAGFVLLWNLMD